MTTSFTSPSQQTPRQILTAAQNAIAKGDFNNAIQSFSILIDHSEQAPNAEFNPVLAVLSRASCYMQLKQFDKALEDALKALKLPVVKTAQELYPGCYSTRSAAASYAADASKALGKQEDFAAYKRMATELMKSDAQRVEEAEKLKEKGNVLFREGKLVEALAVYKEALVKDSTNTAVLSNASLVQTKLGKNDDALALAERCIGLKPDWSKGYYRHGMALLNLKRPTEAAASLQKGLQLSPDDADLKQAYMTAMKDSKIAPSASPSDSEITHAKKMMGMMMDLKHNSWDVRSFFANNPKHVNFGEWDSDIVPLLSQSSTTSLIHRLMTLVYPNFQKGTPPVGPNPYLSKNSSPTSWNSYVLPEHPLIIAVMLLYLFTVSGNGNWTIAFTHQPDPSIFLGTALYEHVKVHRTYAVLVRRDEEEEEVLDFLACWCDSVDGGNKGKDGFMGRVLKESAKEGDQVVVYTCGEVAKGVEYVEGYYKGLNGETGTESMPLEPDADDSQEETPAQNQKSDEDAEFEELQKKVKITEHQIGGDSAPMKRNGASRRNNRVCYGWLERETLVELGIGTALSVAGIAVVLMYF
ncbi:Stress-induced-phosphoprotein 1 [Rhizoclosmatium sp. JEL0117]|nr:Stress-induced-phosphoprotein 1 [Rhizoclosmatium sp. JEL0117]